MQVFSFKIGKPFCYLNSFLNDLERKTSGFSTSFTVKSHQNTPESLNEELPPLSQNSLLTYFPNHVRKSLLWSWLKCLHMNHLGRCYGRITRPLLANIWQRQHFLTPCQHRQVLLLFDKMVRQWAPSSPSWIWQQGFTRHRHNTLLQVNGIRVGQWHPDLVIVICYAEVAVHEKISTWQLFYESISVLHCGPIQEPSQGAKLLIRTEQSFW